MVDLIYFTTPDDFTRGHLVKLKGKCFSLDESKQLLPAKVEETEECPAAEQH